MRSTPLGQGLHQKAIQHVVQHFAEERHLRRRDKDADDLSYVRKGVTDSPLPLPVTLPLAAVPLLVDCCKQAARLLARYQAKPDRARTRVKDVPLQTMLNTRQCCCCTRRGALAIAARLRRLAHAYAKMSHLFTPGHQMPLQRNEELLSIAITRPASCVASILPALISLHSTRRFVRAPPHQSY